MFQSLLLGRPFGIRTYVHWSFWLLLGFVALGELHAGLLAVATTLLLFAAIFACVVLHELGHALTARRFGIRTHDIVLYPIGGVARLERMPEKPSQELLIALAGPAVNIAIAAFLMLLFGIALPSFALALTGGLIANLVAINLMLALFNLLPVFPMDGGRVLRALLATRFSYVRATGMAATAGKYAALAMAGIGLVSFHPMLIILALFIYLAGQQELFMVRLRHSPPVFVRTGPFEEVIDVTPRR